MGLTSNRNKTNTKVAEKTLLKNYASCFEIPVINFEEALRFGNYLYEIDIKTNETGDYNMAFFPVKGSVGGAIVWGPGSVPSNKGSLLYLNGVDDLNNLLIRVKEAGGPVIMPKTLISKEYGYFAIFIDRGGNKMAFHSNN